MSQQTDTHKYEFLAMTTPCVLILHHAQEAVADKVANEIHEYTRFLEKKYNFYNPQSWLNTTINERSSDKVALDEEAITVLSQVREVSALTAGVFDICVGTVKSHKNLADGKRVAELDKLIAKTQPSREQLLEQYQAAMGLEAWKIVDNHIEFAHRMTRLDLGGVIKEYAVDKAAEIVRKHGLSGMISFGGDLSVVGVKPTGKPYRIGIKDPFNPNKSCMNLPVTDEALTTSGLYERQETIAGKSYAHIITPMHDKFDEQQPSEQKSKQKTEQQIEQPKTSKAKILSATVVNKSTLVSGMLSTALMINPDIELVKDCKVILIDENAEVKARKS